MAATTVPIDIDRLPLAALEKIHQLVDSLPDDFECPSSQAHQKSITATLRFPGGLQDQINSLNSVLTASTVTPTLYRNLMHARRLLERFVERVAEGEGSLAELVGDIQWFLGANPVGDDLL